MSYPAPGTIEQMAGTVYVGPEERKLVVHFYRHSWNEPEGSYLEDDVDSYELDGNIVTEDELYRFLGREEAEAAIAQAVENGG